MAVVRNTIQLLATIFYENGASRIKAETFRQAKFDSDGVTSEFWCLLFELVYFCQYGRIDSGCMEAYTQFSPEELTTCVKNDLVLRGFRSVDFASLPGDKSRGSRELLLAVGWIVCKENIIDKFMTYCSPHFDENFTRNQFDQGHGAIKLEYEPLKPTENAEEMMHQALWLHNKLQLELKNLVALQKERNTLQDQLYRSTEGVSLVPGRNHLSVTEMAMLQNPQLMENNLLLMEHDSARLGNLIRWSDHQDTFWKWMESVIDLQMAASESGPPCSTDVVPPSTMMQLMTSQLQLQQAVKKYEDILRHLESHYDHERVDVSEEEIDRLRISLEDELQVHSKCITSNIVQSHILSRTSHDCLAWRRRCGESHGSKYMGPIAAGITHLEPRAYAVDTLVANMDGLSLTSSVAHRSKCMAPAAVTATPLEPWATPAAEQHQTGSCTQTEDRRDAESEHNKLWCDVEDELASLEDAVSHLQAKLEARQTHYLSELQAMGMKLPNTIVIPPLNISR